MTKSSTPLSVHIVDSEYRIACPEGERESLQAAAEYLDQTMREIRESGKVLGMERIAVMAALNISHELLKCHRSSDSLNAMTDSRLQELSAKIDAAIHKLA